VYSPNETFHHHHRVKSLATFAAVGLYRRPTLASSDSSGVQDSGTPRKNGNVWTWKFVDPRSLSREI